ILNSQEGLSILKKLDDGLLIVLSALKEPDAATSLLKVIDGLGKEDGANDTNIEYEIAKDSSSTANVKSEPEKVESAPPVLETESEVVKENDVANQSKTTTGTHSAVAADLVHDLIASMSANPVDEISSPPEEKAEKKIEEAAASTEPAAESKPQSQAESPAKS